MGRQAKQRLERRRSRSLEPAVPVPPAVAPPRSPWRRWRLPALVVAVLLIGGILWTVAGRRRSNPVAENARPPERALAVSVAEAEPNDTVAAAQMLPWPDSDVAGSAAGGPDVYGLSTTMDGAFLIDVWLESGDGLELDVASRNRSRRTHAVAPGRIGSFGVSRDGGPVFITVTAPAGAAPVYLLRVRARRLAPGEEWEPNDEAEQARAELRSRLTGAWSHPDDVDCFLVPLAIPPAGAVLSFRLAPPPGTRARLRVLDSGDPEAKVAPRLLAETSSPAPGQAAMLPALGGRSWEPHYVACTEAESGGGGPGRYTLLVNTWTPAGPFEFEPNDTPETASALPVSGRIAGYLPAGDVDWYTVSHAPGEVRVAVTLPAEARAELALYDGERREVARATSNPDGPLETVAPAAAFARVRVTAGGSTGETYTITRSAPGPAEAGPGE